MNKDTEFARILDWSDRLNSSVAAAKVDHNSTANLVASAEYELQQLRRHLSTVQVAPEPAKPAPGLDQKRDMAAQFNMKQRHPDKLRLM